MKTLKVLSVDDEQGMRIGMQRALAKFVVDINEVDEQVGFDILLAETGEEAVELIRSEKPDILLLDYKLPGINGLEVLEETSAEAPLMLPIMITAYASIETAIAATKQGAYDFLPKPFTPADLRHTVRKAATRVVLARRAKELEDERKKIRFEFIRVLGHELKTPLSAVTGYLNIMKDKVLGETIAPYEEMTERCLIRLDQMNKMILDLLDMTRLESGERIRKLQSVDVKAAAESSVEMMKLKAEERNITINLDIAPVTMIADTQEIEIVLNNLISNAIKYNRDDGTVDVRVTMNSGELVIRVADTGIGMTPDERNKLFGEFVRIRNNKTKDILGSGLGLSILKKVAKLYDGSIEVESTHGEGSVFTVRLMEIKPQVNEATDEAANEVNND